VLLVMCQHDLAGGVIRSGIESLKPVWVGLFCRGLCVGSGRLHHDRLRRRRSGSVWRTRRATGTRRTAVEHVADVFELASDEAKV